MSASGHKQTLAGVCTMSARANADIIPVDPALEFDGTLEASLDQLIREHNDCRRKREPKRRATLSLAISSNLVGNWIGISAGF